jgi:hypothetical protein
MNSLTNAHDLLQKLCQPRIAEYLVCFDAVQHSETRWKRDHQRISLYPEAAHENPSIFLPTGFPGREKPHSRNLDSRISEIPKTWRIRANCLPIALHRDPFLREFPALRTRFKRCLAICSLETPRLLHAPSAMHLREVNEWAARMRRKHKGF